MELVSDSLNYFPDQRGLPLGFPGRTNVAVETNQDFLLIISQVAHGNHLFPSQNVVTSL